MRNISKVKHLGILVFVFMLVYACKDADYDVINNSIYFPQAGAEQITVADGGSAFIVQVRMAQRAENPVKVNIGIDEKVLEEYNKKMSSGYVLLPAEFFNLEEKNTTIQKGRTNSDPIELTIKPLTPELNKTGFTYAIPLQIQSVESKLPILESQSSQIYIITPTPYADVPVMKRGNGMKMSLKNEAVTVTDYTVEFLVKIDNLGLRKNNQILFNAADFSKGEGGTDGEIFMRFAADGAAGKWDKFQLKNQGLNFDAQTSFKNNVWYHIACVNDNKSGTMYIYVNGKMDSKFSNAQMSTTVNSSSPRGFRFCGESDNDSYMKSNVQASEIRFWSVTRTENQIKNNMYGVSPTSQGLIGYWKMNEGEGNILKDISGNENNAILFGSEANWLLNQKVEVGN